MRWYLPSRVAYDPRSVRARDTPDVEAMEFALFGGHEAYGGVPPEDSAKVEAVHPVGGLEPSEVNVAALAARARAETSRKRLKNILFCFHKFRYCTCTTTTKGVPPYNPAPIPYNADMITLRVKSTTL